MRFNLESMDINLLLRSVERGHYLLPPAPLPLQRGANSYRQRHHVRNQDLHQEEILRLRLLEGLPQVQYHGERAEPGADSWFIQYMSTSYSKVMYCVDLLKDIEYFKSA